MPVLYLICALLLGAAPAAAQPPAAPAATETKAFVVFLRGRAIGREEVAVKRGDEILISVTGRLGPPLEITTRRAEVRYTRDWSPVSLAVDATIQGRDETLRTTFKDGAATTDATQGGKPLQKTDPVPAQAVVLPNGVFGFHEALALRLAPLAEGAELPVYIAPQAAIRVRLKSVLSERIQLGSSSFAVRRYVLVFPTPAGDLEAQLTADERGGLVRFSVAAQSLDVVRDDVASSTSRTQAHRNPGDEAVTIPAAGFNLGATVTRPANAAGQLPAVVLVSSYSASDRDGVSAGVPIMGQIAGALADAGYLTVRFDKRGSGQSGGRAESATLTDHAEDTRAILKWLSGRKDVDRRRIAILGHGDGAMVALAAAARDRGFAAIVTLAAPGVTGAEMVLEQQQAALAQMNLPQPERDAKVALQKRINAAVLTGTGWDGVPPEVRKQAESAWFRSLLAFDPAKVIEDVRQPLLIVHGELDRQVAVSHAERLATLARAESKSKAVELVTVRGVNHLLVPATTGAVAEYGSLPDRNVSKDVTAAIAKWLGTLTGRR